MSQGTSDEHLSLLEHLAPVRNRLSSVIVTTPQAVALADALKCLSFTRAVGLPVLGLVENMSGYVCPCCGEVANVFSTGGGRAMAETEGVPFLGSLPVDTDLVTLLDAAEPEPEPGTSAEAETGERARAGQAEAEVGAAFEVLERYQRTSSAKLFKDVVEMILQTLPRVEERAPVTEVLA
jgi:MinD-like ATPase involved in chromosome partitioning or flagellar assembly